MKPGRASPFGGDQGALQMMAFCAAGLLTLLSLPHIWWASGWLTSTVLTPEFGYDWEWLMRLTVFGLLVGIALGAARMSMTSSVVVAGFWLMTKLPIF